MNVRIYLYPFVPLTYTHTDIHTYTHAGIHTYIDQYRSIDRFIAPSIYLSTPPSIYRSFYPRKSHMPASQYIKIFPRTFVDASVHKRTYMRPVVY